jgi:hypothetical protein
VAVITSPGPLSSDTREGRGGQGRAGGGAQFCFLCHKAYGACRALLSECLLTAVQESPHLPMGSASTAFSVAVPGGTQGLHLPGKHLSELHPLLWSLLRCELKPRTYAPICFIF